MANTNITSSSASQNNSRYNVGGITTIDGTINGNNIGWWERAVYPSSPTDVKVVVDKQYSRRPDLMAYDMYGKASLQWVILQFNNISDVNVDFIEGTVVYLPTKERLFTSMLTQSQLHNYVQT